MRAIFQLFLLLLAAMRGLRAASPNNVRVIIMNNVRPESRQVYLHTKDRCSCLSERECCHDYLL